MQIIIKSILDDKTLFKLTPEQMSKLEYDLKLPTKDDVLIYNKQSYIVKQIVRAYIDKHDIYGERTKLEDVFVIVDQI